MVARREPDPLARAVVCLRALSYATLVLWLVREEQAAGSLEPGELEAVEEAARTIREAAERAGLDLERSTAGE